jgi:hypothetical protein
MAESQKKSLRLGIEKNYRNRSSRSGFCYFKNSSQLLLLKIPLKTGGSISILKEIHIL